MSEGNATVQIFLVDAVTRYQILGKANQDNFDKVDSVIHSQYYKYVDHVGMFQQFNCLFRPSRPCFGDF